MRKQFTDDSGQRWSYDEGAALRLIGHYARLKAMNETTRVVTTRESLIQKLYLANELAQVDTDVNRMLQRKAEVEAVTGRRFATLMLGAADDAQSYLFGLRRDVNRLTLANQSVYRRAQDINQAAIDHAETAIKITKGVRDGSILTLGVIATVSTGGLTLAVASGTGVGLQATATYQDTGSVSKAAVKGALFMLPLGTKQISLAAGAAGASTTVTTAMSLAIDTGAETFEGVYVNDADLDKAFGAALTNQLMGFGIGNVAAANTRWMGQRLRGAIRIVDSHGQQMSNRAWPLISQMGGKLVGESLKVSPASQRANAMAAGGVRMAGRGMANDSPVGALRSPRNESEAYIMRHVLSRI